MASASALLSTRGALRARSSGETGRHESWACATGAAQKTNKKTRMSEAERTNANPSLKRMRNLNNQMSESLQFSVLRAAAYGVCTRLDDCAYFTEGLSSAFRSP